MSTESEIKRLAALKMPQTDIATELNISRQRVGQVFKKHGLSVERKQQRGAFRQPPVPKSRVITGGVAGPVSANVCGLIAELLVAADLMARGWKVFMPLHRSAGHDLVAMHPDDRKLRSFEVRSAHRRPGGAISYHKRSSDAADHYALVCTGEPVAYQPDLT